MNILVIGVENSIHDFKWIIYIAQRFEGKIYCISEWPNKANPHYAKKYEEAGVTLLPSIPLFSISSPFRTWKTIRKINKIIAEKNIDLIHVIFPTPHLYWTTFSSPATIVSTRGSDVLVVMRDMIKNGGVLNKILYLLLKKNLKKIKAITSTSEAQEEFLNAHFPFLTGKTSIVRTGVDINFIENVAVEQGKTEKKIIFSPRFFSEIYNIKSQINALKLLPQDLQKQIKIIFVRGKAYDAQYEKQIIHSLENVNFEYEILVYLNPEEMVRQYKNADLVLMTPTSDGTPNSALEAMVCKRPLIMSNLAYNSPLFTDTCFMANPNDENDISEKIKLALENYPKDKLEKAYQAVKTYGNQATEMQKIIDLYRSIGK